MLSAEQIRVLAGQSAIDPGILEKDYVLSKVLTALSEIELVGDALVFKGGTALKKFYFSDWRYSEDLDFTARHQLSPHAVKEVFTRACDGALDTFGLALRIMEYSQYPKNGDIPVTSQLKIGYEGPLRRTSGQKNNIRVDITFDEPIIDEPRLRSMIKSYADDVDTSIPAYTLEEIVAEKLRSILQRGKSRDYYDVLLLLRDHRMDFSLELTRDILEQKCSFKGIPFPTIEDFLEETRAGEARRYWERGLAHQLTNLPDFDELLSELKEALKTLL